MSGMLDLYLKEKIMSRCEASFNEFLKEHDAEEEKLTDKDREIIESQIDYLMDMVEEIYLEFEKETDALIEITDRLIGICIMGKMNEARLCNVINKLVEKEDD